MPALAPVPEALTDPGLIETLAWFLGNGLTADVLHLTRDTRPPIESRDANQGEAFPENTTEVSELAAVVSNFLASPLNLVAVAIGAEQVRRALQRWRHRRRSSRAPLPSRPTRPAAPHGRSRVRAQPVALERVV